MATTRNCFPTRRPRSSTTLYAAQVILVWVRTGQARSRAFSPQAYRPGLQAWVGGDDLSFCRSPLQRAYPANGAMARHRKPAQSGLRKKERIAPLHTMAQAMAYTPAGQREQRPVNGPEENTNPAKTNWHAYHRKTYSACAGRRPRRRCGHAGRIPRMAKGRRSAGGIGPIRPIRPIPGCWRRRSSRRQACLGKSCSVWLGLLRIPMCIGTYGACVFSDLFPTGAGHRGDRPFRCRSRTFSRARVILSRRPPSLRKSCSSRRICWSRR